VPQYKEKEKGCRIPEVVGYQELRKDVSIVDDVVM